MNYVFLANGFEEIETTAVIDILRRAQMDVCTISITPSREVIGAHQIPIVADAVLSDVDFGNAEYLILPGGMPGAQNLLECAPLTEVLKHHYAQQRPLAAICAAPFVLGQLGLLRGKRATCYPGFEKYLTAALYTNKGVVTDSNLVTAQGPAFAIEFGLHIVEQAKGADVANEIRSGMLGSY